MSTPIDLQLSALLDILIVAGLIWSVIIWFRNSPARLALVGLAAVGLLFVVARGLQLELTTLLLQGFFAVVALMMVVVFQDDLRRLFERIAVWGLRRQAPHPPPDVEQTLVQTLFRLAEARVGSLVILPGRELLDRHLEGGVHLGGRLSEALLLSLFDPATPGHDGAVLVGANKVMRFGVHLPLSTDWDRLGQGGTRHAAALGLAERSDAMCLVVSEERGVVSVANRGEIFEVSDSEELARQVHQFIRRSTRSSAPQSFRALRKQIRAGWREGIFALAMAGGLWYLAVPGGAQETADRRVAVVVENLPEGYELLSVDPADVIVRFKGRRRDLYLAGASDLSVRVDAILAELGRRTFSLDPDQVQHPEEVEVISVSPRKVKLSVKKP